MYNVTYILNVEGIDGKRIKIWMLAFVAYGLLMTRSLVTAFVRFEMQTKMAARPTMDERSPLLYYMHLCGVRQLRHHA